MNSKKNIRFPLRSTLLSMDRSKRSSWLLEYLEMKLAHYKDLSSGESLKLDDAFTSDALKIPDEESWNAFTDYLFGCIKNDFDLHTYYFDKNPKTINDLISFIENNVVEIFNPSKQPSIQKPYFNKALWRWNMPPAQALDDINFTESRDEQSEDSQIVFLLSSPRSGSTIFRLMLASHQQLFAPPELHLLPFQTMGERAKQIDEQGFPWMRAGFAEALMDLDGITLDQGLQRVNELETLDISIVEAYQYLMKRNNGRILVDKTPFYACHLAWLQQAERMFKNPKYIFLTRHPLSMIQSFVKLRLKALTRDRFGYTSDSPWLLAEKWWLMGNQNMLDFLKNIPSERQIHLSYESLIADTEASLQKVCKLLSIPLDHRMLNPYANNSHSMIQGIGDPNIMNFTKIEPSLADSWRKCKVPQTLSKSTLALAQELGYEFCR